MKLTDVSTVLCELIAAKESAMLIGPSGCGKSEVTMQTAELMDMDLIDFRLVYRDSVDIRGLPVPDFDKGVTRMLPPAELKFEGRPKLIFADEINSAPTSVQAAMYQAFQERAFGEVKMRDCDAIIAAGNRSVDLGVTNRIPKPLRRRWFEINIEPDAVSWCAWAVMNDISPLTIAFIRNMPHLLYDHHADQQSPDPRAWTKVDKIMSRATLPQDLLHELIIGKVGEGAATEYSAYTRLYASLPPLDEILRNPTTAPVPHDPASMYAIGAALGRKADVGNISKVCQYLERMSPEYAVFAIRDAIRRDEKLQKTQGYVQWANKHKHLLI